MGEEIKDSWRWQMPPDRAVVEMTIPDVKVPVRVVLQGTAAGWTKVVRIEIGDPDGLIPRKLVPPERMRSKSTVLIGQSKEGDELPGLLPKDVRAAITAIYREQRWYQRTWAWMRGKRGALTHHSWDYNAVRTSAAAPTGDERLQLVAAIYREMVTAGATSYADQLAKTLQCTPDMARQYVAEARRRGYLQKAIKGTTGEKKTTKKTTKKGKR